ncbi:variant leucine-rich repeat-containing protein [Actinomyces oris]
MDPVQLMMAAHQADATVAAQTPDQALQAAIAQSRPDLWAPLSTNPAAYPELLGWLASTGNVEVLANLRARGYLTDDAAANAADSAGAAGAAGAAAEADSATGEPAVDPAFSQEDPAQTEPTESAEVAESVADGGTPVDEDEAADEPDAETATGEAQESRPDDSGDEAEGGAEDAGSGEVGDEQDTEEPAEDSEGAEDAEAESLASEDQHVEDAAVDADDGELGTEEPAEDSEDSDAAETATEPDAEPEVADEVATDADEAQESGTDQPEDEASEEQAAEDSGAAEDTVDADSGEAGVEPETEEPAEDSENSGDVEGDEAESPDSQDQQVEDAAVDESADERGAESAEAAEEPGTDESAEDSGDSDEAETAVDPGAETATDEAADSGNNDTTVLATASQRHEVDSADTTDFTASAQSAAVTSGWTAGSAAPAASSAESVAFPVPPPPSAEDIAAWAETPSGAPSGFSAAQPAVELDMFGPQMMAQMPPPQQKQPAKSNSGRLIAIIVVLLLVIAGGGGLWAGSHFANKDKSEDTSQNKADSDGGEDGKQNGQADAAATSTAAALPSGAVKACSSMPTFTITSVEDGQGELKVHGNMATSCAEGDFLAGSSSQVLVYSSTSPTGGADVDHLVASGTFDLSSDPLIIPNGGRAVTLRFGEQHYFRTAKDLDLKGLTVRPSFDRGSSSTATAKSSTNSAMTIASSASSNANQEAQDEQAAGDAIQWQIKHDYPIVMNSLRGKWTPQLSSKQVGLVADGQTWTKRLILAEYLKTQQANPKAVIIDTSQWPVYDTAGWWVTLQGDSYSDGDQANAWCDAQGYDSDHCLAKRIESNGTSQGTTKLR